MLVMQAILLRSDGELSYIVNTQLYLYRTQTELLSSGERRSIIFVCLDNSADVVMQMTDQW